jgi:hypothetical protein
MITPRAERKERPLNLPAHTFIDLGKEVGRQMIDVRSGWRRAIRTESLVFHA